MQRVLPDAFSVSHAHEEGLLACLLTQALGLLGCRL